MNIRKDGLTRYICLTLHYHMWVYSSNFFGSGGFKFFSLRSKLCLNSDTLIRSQIYSNIKLLHENWTIWALRNTALHYFTFNFFGKGVSSLVHLMLNSARSTGSSVYVARILSRHFCCVGTRAVPLWNVCLFSRGKPYPQYSCLC